MEFIQFFSTQWAFIRENADHVWVILGAAFLIGIAVMRFADSGEIRGLKSSNQALKDQLDLATKEQSAITPEIAQLRATVEKLSNEQAELKAQIEKAQIPQLEKMVATTASIERA